MDLVPAAGSGEGGTSMLSEGIEWVAGVDKTDVDLRDGFCNHAVRLPIIKLALKFNDCPIGVVDA
ncbi:MAG TPA: hypothetical protein VGU90_12740, partial [Terriglobales bacterium]|nr:hypothetical protein [Terriglobales bacterium]